MGESKRRSIIVVLEKDQETRLSLTAALETKYDILPIEDHKHVALLAVSAVDLILASIDRSEDETIAEACEIRTRLGGQDRTPVVIYSARSIEDGEEKVIPGRVYLIREENLNHLRALLRRLLHDRD